MPIMINKNNKATAVIMPPEEYDRVYIQQFKESITKGVADGDTGYVISTEELERQLSERRKLTQDKYITT
ncbi:MAG: hypothetical protein Q7U04_04905 [Bacteriovorax sp.]|nr:hypothetical protein [Bacteriovorax sp.]